MRTIHSEVSSFELIGRVCAIAPALDKRHLFRFQIACLGLLRFSFMILSQLSSFEKPFTHIPGEVHEA